MIVESIFCFKGSEELKEWVGNEYAEAMKTVEEHKNMAKVHT